MRITNVLIINDFAHVNGGASQVALSSAIGLAQNGYRVTIFTAVAPIMTTLPENGIEVICTGQTEILKNPNRLMATMQGLWNLKAGYMLSKRLETLEKANTIVHLHSWTKALSSSIVRVAVNKSFKVVCTLHDYFIACPNGGFFNYQTNKICNLHPLSLKCIVQHCDARSYLQKNWRVMRQFIQKLFGMIPSGIRRFIFVSDFSLDIIKPYLPSKTHFYFVPNPIESEKSTTAVVSKNSIYVSIGRLSKEKGILLLAKAAKLCGFPVIFVGDGECRPDIQVINPDAKITGWVSRKEVNTCLDQACVLVFSSQCYETQGIAVLEAASRGCPIHCFR